MSGKFEKKTQKRKMPVWLPVLAIVIVAGIAAAVLLPRMNQPGKTPEQTMPHPETTADTTPAQETEPSVRVETVPTAPVEISSNESICAVCALG